MIAVHICATQPVRDVEPTAQSILTAVAAITAEAGSANRRKQMDRAAVLTMSACPDTVLTASVVTLHAMAHVRLAISEGM